MRTQRLRLRTVAVGLLAAVAVVSSGGIQSSAADPVTPGSAGIDTSLPPTDSAVTVQGRGRFSSLRITVNQTRKLNNQAVSITWTGGTPTLQGPGRFAQHYLQIFQCWGDDDGASAENPGPPPEQCVQGAVGGNYNGPPQGIYPNILATTRIVFRSTWAGYNPSVGYTDPRTTNVWMPFRSVTGETVNVQANPNFNPAIVGGNYWLNPYFNEITTNEIAGAVTDANGNGAELFQVNTGIESTGLGCGQRVQTLQSGTKKIPQCWIVVVPRGSAADENAGSPFGGNDPDQFGVATSPLSPMVWPNRIAIPIDFNPVDSPCDISKQDRRIAGNELALGAVSSWQPVLCTTGSQTPYSYANVSDDTARGQIANPVAGAAGMAIVNGPVPAGTFDASKPIVYAPLAISGLVVGFNVERVPKISAPQAEQELAGVRVATIKLTPRLLAKLLTQSYVRALGMGGVIPSLSWLENNPLTLASDPDFLRFNPEFALLQIANPRNFSQLTVPATAADATIQLWKYVLADPEARTWLSGTPDEWGMRVNPVYSTNAQTNPSGTSFGDPVPNSFPKSDPTCYQAPNLGSVVPAQLCGTDWVPYSRGYSESAQMTRAASDGARVEFNIFAAVPADAWKREAPQALGYRSFLSLTDTASAARFGLQVASLSRAGDNGADRAFIAPTSNALSAGVAAMVAGSEPTVLEPKPDAVAPAAYPLTLLSYAAISPLSSSAAIRKDYAAFVKYAVQEGQVPGLSPGQLPQGYSPLSESLKAAALTAADQILSMQPGATSGGGGGGGGGSNGGTGSFVPESEPTDTTVVADATPTTTLLAPTDSVAQTVETAMGPERSKTPPLAAGAMRLTVIVLLLVALLAVWVLVEVWARSRPRARSLWSAVRGAGAVGR